ncbi:MAG: hypothetical protein DMF71_02240 [Acidobacteria bacterium]|nr:MAG: hypothetical protein DMF71_02240 [Acidobacteriota bacterium]
MEIMVLLLFEICAHYVTRERLTASCDGLLCRKIYNFLQITLAPKQFSLLNRITMVIPICEGG